MAAYEVCRGVVTQASFSQAWPPYRWEGAGLADDTPIDVDAHLIVRPTGSHREAISRGDRAAWTSETRGLSARPTPETARW